MRLYLNAVREPAVCVLFVRDTGRSKAVFANGLFAKVFVRSRSAFIGNKPIP